MKALTLTQPWATLVAIGEKTIETRSWFTNYRGVIAIHAAKSFGKVKEGAAALFREPFTSVLLRHGLITHTLEVDRRGERRRISYRALPLGAIVATANLADCISTNRGITPLFDDSEFPRPDHEIQFGDYSPGRFMWELRDVRALPQSIPCRGSLGLWGVPAEVAALLPGENPAKTAEPRTQDVDRTSFADSGVYAAPESENAKS